MACIARWRIDYSVQHIYKSSRPCRDYAMAVSWLQLKHGWKMWGRDLTHSSPTTRLVHWSGRWGGRWTRSTEKCYSQSQDASRTPPAIYGLYRRPDHVGWSVPASCTASGRLRSRLDQLSAPLNTLTDTLSPIPLTDWAQIAAREAPNYTAENTAVFCVADDLRYQYRLSVKYRRWQIAELSLTTTVYYSSLFSDYYFITTVIQMSVTALVMVELGTSALGNKHVQPTYLKHSKFVVFLLSA